MVVVVLLFSGVVLFFSKGCFNFVVVFLVAVWMCSNQEKGDKSTCEFNHHVR